MGPITDGQLTCPLWAMNDLLRVLRVSVANLEEHWGHVRGIRAWRRTGFLWFPDRESRIRPQRGSAAESAG
jgi:hypothetical protein